jgi:hypothetical protein
MNANQQKQENKQMQKNQKRNKNKNKNKNNNKNLSQKVDKLIKEEKKVVAATRSNKMAVAARTFAYSTRELATAQREARAYDAVDGSYIKCVFDPYTNPPARIPSIFPSPTSLFKWTQLVDITVPPTGVGSRSFVVICPWNLVSGNSSGSNEPSFISFSVGAAATPAAEFQTRISHPMQGFLGNVSSASTNTRFTSFRTVACQAIVECTAPVLNIQGTITGACLPGLGFPSVVSGGFTPQPTQLIQHPFGFQREIKDLSSEWPFQVNYFPLDPLDQIFHNENEPSDQVQSRSPIIIYFENIQANTQFRLRVTSVVEYVPSMYFRPWADTRYSADKPRSIEVVRSVVTQNPKLAVSGALDAEIGRIPNQTTGDNFLSTLKKLTKGVTSVTDEMGMVPRLIGTAIRSGLEAL